jgi:hypothetical protein
MSIETPSGLPVQVNELSRRTTESSPGCKPGGSKAVTRGVVALTFYLLSALLPT